MTLDPPSRLIEMAEIDIADENLRDLKAIQRVVLFEDELEASLDEILARVLGFYRKFVPYN